ncbi:MAG: hypothetical protein A2Z52_00920 [Candidatus Moranbacteria bacterium RBG_19FT_COMBO_42_6]|nr:MAG: hypothetical protein A2Z52_00920 [Candidatus Moranbacteria bacterium RBG_19FT_COMBO_42_6]
MVEDIEKCVTKLVGSPDVSTFNVELSKHIFEHNICVKCGLEIDDTLRDYILSQKIAQLKFKT